MISPATDKHSYSNINISKYLRYELVPPYTCLYQYFIAKQPGEGFKQLFKHCYLSITKTYLILITILPTGLSSEVDYLCSLGICWHSASVSLADAMLRQSQLANHCNQHPLRCPLRMLLWHYKMNMIGYFSIFMTNIKFFTYYKSYSLFQSVPERQLSERSLRLTKPHCHRDPRQSSLQMSDAIEWEILGWVEVGITYGITHRLIEISL